MTGNPQRRVVECVIPVLPVNDLEESIRFYSKTLEFNLDWRGESVGSVSKDGNSIMLKEVPSASSGMCVWIGLHDASLFDVYRRRGVKVVSETRNHSWAYEMKFEDLDGNVLWLGTEPRSDIPFVD
jgi:predicted lactoylglutathione lyase